MPHDFATNRRNFLKLAGLTAAAGSIPASASAWPIPSWLLRRATATASDAARNKIYVVSDIHIGDDSPTCWYQKRYHEPFLLRILDEILANRDRVREVILLGDVMDFWTYAPEVRPPSFADIAAANPNVFGPGGKLVEVLRALQGRVTVLQGNHDLGFTQREWDTIRTPEGLTPRLVGDLYQPLDNDPRLVVAHGHHYTMFNAPDPSTQFAPMPVGYYVTRSVAHRVRERLGPTAQTAADLPDQGAPNGMDIAAAFHGIIDDLPASANKNPDVVTLLLELIRVSCGMNDDTPIILPNGRESSLRDAKQRYHGLWQRWKNAGGGGYAGGMLAGKALEADAESKYLGWFAQKLAIQRGAELVVMGHTHFPIQGLVTEPGEGKAICNYLNTGFGCRSEPDAKNRGVSYAVIDTDTMEAHTYQVNRAPNSSSFHYDVDRDQSGADSVNYKPYFDYSTYVQIDNTRGSVDLVRASAKNEVGHYVVPPPEKVAAGSKAGFWIQDEAGVRGSEGTVTYGAGSKSIRLEFECPTGILPNKAKASGGVKVYAKTRAERDWGGAGDVPRGGHPLFVKYVV